MQIDSSKRNIVGDICYLWDYEDQLMWGFCMEESVLLEDIYVDPHRPLNLIIPIHIVYNNAYCSMSLDHGYKVFEKQKCSRQNVLIELPQQAKIR